MRTTRKILSIVAALFAALMLVETLTVPSISATAPAILTVALAVAAWFLWPRGKTETSVVSPS